MIGKSDWSSKLGKLEENEQNKMKLINIFQFSSPW